MLKGSLLRSQWPSQGFIVVISKNEEEPFKNEGGLRVVTNFPIDPFRITSFHVRYAH